jgi:hypothetical protein
VLAGWHDVTLLRHGFCRLIFDDEIHLCLSFP